jgi:hypothetical protein
MICNCLILVQEHVRKSIPTLIEKKNETETFQNNIKGARFDLDYSIEAVVKMSNADKTFDVNFIFINLVCSFNIIFDFLKSSQSKS